VRSLLLAFALVLALPVSSALAAGTLTVGITGAGAVSGSGIDCSRDAGPTTGTCSVLVKDVTECETDPKPHCTTDTGIAAVRAGAAAGFAFDGWTGPCEDPASTICTVTMDGNQRVTARFKDAVTPNVSLVAPGAGALSGTVAVGATASDNVAVDRVEFSVRGVVTFVDSTAPYGGNFNTTSVADGAATITATAIDTSGLAKSASVSTTIDNTKPALAVTGPDKQAFTLGTTQSWAIAASDPTSGIAQVRCSLVAFGTPPSFGLCSTGVTAHSVTGKPEGAYTFSVRALDAAGNVSDVTRTFKIDATAPDTMIASGLDDGAATRDAALTWALSSDESATFECRVYPAALTPGAFAPCSDGASHTASGFAPGVYAFEARATDAVGNVDASPVKRTFTILAPLPVSPATVVAAAVTPSVGGGAARAAAPPQIVVTLGFSFSSLAKATKLAGLVVKNIPAGATVTVKCPKGCAKKSFKKAKVSGQLSLQIVVKKPLKLGTKLTVIVSKPGSSSAVKVLTIRARKAPLVTTQCQPEGSSKPAAC
jgi:uncharacterized repeat protein (TIGR02543 family)